SGIASARSFLKPTISAWIGSPPSRSMLHISPRRPGMPSTSATRPTTWLTRPRRRMGTAPCTRSRYRCRSRGATLPGTGHRLFGECLIRDCGAEQARDLVELYVQPRVHLAGLGVDQAAADLDGAVADDGKRRGVAAAFVDGGRHDL